MLPSLTFKNLHPGIVVVDEFLENPLEHREYALNLEYEKKGSYGVRSKHVYPYAEYRDQFEKLLGRKINQSTWLSYGVNGCYQWCNRHQELVWHVDGQDYAAMIYLTPDAPPSSGTSFWQSKHSRARMIGPNSNVNMTLEKVLI